MLYGLAGIAGLILHIIHDLYSTGSVPGQDVPAQQYSLKQRQHGNCLGLGMRESQHRSGECQPVCNQKAIGQRKVVTFPEIGRAHV